jgi:hypothetical protein
MNGRFDLQTSIARLASTASRLDLLIVGLTESQLRSRPDPEAFSIKENVLHLRDIEMQGYGPRLRRILTEKNPLLPDVDGTRLATERRYNEQPMAPAVEEFRQAREECVGMLRRVTAQHLTRTAQMEKVGSITLAQLIGRWCDHDEEHLAAVEKLCSELRGKA